VSTVHVRTVEGNVTRAAAWHPETEAERVAVREELERILSNPLFTNSRRYPRLLRHVVERTLEALLVIEAARPCPKEELSVPVCGKLDPVFCS
jgi:hypothetical protein